MDDHAARVMDWVSRPGYEPVTLKALARQLRVSDEEYGAFRATVKALLTAALL